MPSMSVKEIVLDSVSFQVNHEYEEKTGPEGFSYRVKRDSQVDLDRLDLRVSLGVETPGKVQSPNYPFYFDVTIVGTFVFTEPIGEELCRQYASVNCPAILFPYLRETLADLTRRAGFPPLHLPVTNFVKLAQKEKQPETPVGSPEEKPKKRQAASQGRSTKKVKATK